MTIIDYDTQEVRGMQAGKVSILSSVRAAFDAAGRGNPIPPNERYTGLDVSKWNSVMNWQTAYSAGARFACFKATQGSSYVDSQYNTNRTNCTQMPWGSYHFMSTADGTTQAQHFLDTMGDTPGALPPVLDVEIAMDSAIIRAAAQRIYTVTGAWPLIYTSYYSWSNVTGIQKTWLSERCGLWIAHWNTDYPLLPTGWTTYEIHQYSADKNGLGATYGSPPDGDPDIDLNRARIAWVDSYDPQPTIEQRVSALERRVTELEEAVWPAENIER